MNIARKILTFLLILATITSMAVSISASGPAVEGRKTCIAYIADIEIDGEIDEAWNYAPEIKVDIVKENASRWFGDTTKKAGEDYAVVTAKVLWNGKDKLFLFYQVHDKKISLVSKTEWEQDSLEFFMQPKNSNSQVGKIHHRYEADNRQNFPGFKLTEDGFIFEYAHDLSLAKMNEYVGIDFQYNDDALGEGYRDVCLGWSDTKDKASSDPSVFGQCLLSNLNYDGTEYEAPSTTTKDTTTATDTTAADTTTANGYDHNDITTNDTTANDTSTENKAPEEDFESTGLIIGIVAAVLVIAAVVVVVIVKKKK